MASRRTVESESKRHVAPGARRIKLPVEREDRRETEGGSRNEDRRARDWKRLLILAAVVLLAAIPRFARLDAPGEIMTLDERYYVPEAQSYLDAGVDHITTPHPPLGKLAIAAGIKIFGNSPFGWRVGSALVGTLGILILYLLAKRLWSSEVLAVLAAGLFALDGLWLVQSRIAMLDVYAITFMLAGIWLLIEDRARTSPTHRGRRWWRIASGAAFGLAFASKMTVVPFLLTAIVLALLWETARLAKDPAFRFLHQNRRRAKGPSRIERAERRRYATALGKQGAAIAGTFLLLPWVLYVLTFVPWAGARATHMLDPCEGRSRRVVSAWLCNQQVMLGWNISVPDTVEGKPAHESLTEAWSWPWAGRPVTHFAKSERSGPARSQAPRPQQSVSPSSQASESPPRVAGVVGVPNPVVWFPAFLVAIPALAWWAIRRKDMTAALIVALFAIGYLPYLMGGLMGHAVYFYHASVILPFLVLASVHVFHRLTERSGKAKTLAVGYAAAVVVAFAYFYPVLTAVSIPYDGALGWKAHMWLTLDCAKDTIKNFCWL